MSKEIPTNPILVNSVRGNLIETIFRGSYVVVNSAGTLIDSIGNYQHEIFARSSLKPIQTLAVVESGAADAFALSSQEIALACASHNGEDQHTQLIAKWLQRLGVSEMDLECGIHSPLDKDTEHSLIQRGEKPTPLHNTCSGKHAAFITLALHLGAPVVGYTHPDHPAQRYIAQVIARLTDIDLEKVSKGIDGCQVPVLGMPIEGLAKGMARLANQGKNMGTPAHRLISALQSHPYLVAGKNRFCTQLMEMLEGKVLVKMGVGGVFSAIIPDREWGIALKIDDGCSHAAEVTLIGILDRLELLTSDQNWQPWRNPAILNRNKEVVGHWFAQF